MLANSDTAGFNLVEINKRGTLRNGAITRAISAPEGHDIFRKISEDKGLETVAVLGFVKRSNIKRAVREVVITNGVKIKRLLMLSTKPKD